MKLKVSGKNPSEEMEKRMAAGMISCASFPPSLWARLARGSLFILNIMLSVISILNSFEIVRLNCLKSLA